MLAEGQHADGWAALYCNRFVTQLHNYVIGLTEISLYGTRFDEKFLIWHSETRMFHTNHHIFALTLIILQKKQNLYMAIFTFT